MNVQMPLLITKPAMEIYRYILPAETTVRTADPGGNPFFDLLAVEKVDQQGSATEAP